MEQSFPHQGKGHLCERSGLIHPGVPGSPLNSVGVGSVAFGGADAGVFNPPPAYQAVIPGMPMRAIPPVNPQTLDVLVSVGRGGLARVYQLGLQQVAPDFYIPVRDLVRLPEIFTQLFVPEVTPTLFRSLQDSIQIGGVVSGPGSQ